MRRTHGRTQLLMAVVLILPLSGCLSPRERTPEREEIIEYGTPTDSLTCPGPSVAARADTQVVDMGGGTLQSGNVQLTIPPGALMGRHQFILQRDSGQKMGATVEVQEAVHFQNNVSARLMFDVSGCDRRVIEHPRGWWVWRLNSVEGQSQKLRTVVNPNRAITAIDSTSWFMIAN